MAKMADTVFTAVKAYLGARLETELRKVKTALDERMGEVQAEMLAFVGSFERRMTTLENLPEPKAAGLTRNALGVVVLGSGPGDWGVYW